MIADKNVVMKLKNDLDQLNSEIDKLTALADWKELNNNSLTTDERRAYSLLILARNQTVGLLMVTESQQEELNCQKQLLEQMNRFAVQLAQLETENPLLQKENQEQLTDLYRRVDHLEGKDTNLEGRLAGVETLTGYHKDFLASQSKLIGQLRETVDKYALASFPVPNKRHLS